MLPAVGSTQVTTPHTLISVSVNGSREAIFWMARIDFVPAGGASAALVAGVRRVANTASCKAKHSARDPAKPKLDLRWRMESFKAGSFSWIFLKHNPAG
ncbi:MAG: hypothetical protein B9S38_02860 [Verrucomicrobiia bacterium Tous-C4TDCM]|nr:MAG: hypothetical protein B9S38_02860 [Verrucomicrobiae bacterium Tous-C4TDCM]